MKSAVGSSKSFSRSHLYAALLIGLALFVLWIIKCEPPHRSKPDSAVTGGTSTSKSDTVSLTSVKNFSLHDVMPYSYFRRVCFTGKTAQSLRDLSIILQMLRTREDNHLCKEQQRLLHSIYRVRKRMSDVSVPDKKSKGEKYQREYQTLLFVDNLYSFESVVFNLAKVAHPQPYVNVSEHIRKTVEDARKNCDFCSVKKTTAADTFGMMESKHTVIVSNAFKIQKYHGLAIFKRHHPLEWDQEQFIDCMALIMRWFKKVHEVSPDDVYKVIYWDLLLKSGVSQMHPHMHLVLGNRQYFAKYLEWHHAGLKFSEEHQGANYWTSLVQVYTTLGLTTTFGNATVFASLTPKRDYEVVVIAKEPCLDFFRLVFFALRTFIEDIGEPSVCMGYNFPKSGAPAGGRELPMLFRLVSRGDPASLQSDIGSYDLYGTPNINRDPYKVIRAIRESVKKRGKKKFDFKWV